MRATSFMTTPEPYVSLAEMLQENAEDAEETRGKIDIEHTRSEG